MILVREYETETAILGRLYLNGGITLYTLENKATAIPLGRYSLEVGRSPKFKRDLPLIYGEMVAANRGIRIHRGNGPEDSSGCVLVGLGTGNHRLTDSAIAEQITTLAARSDQSLVVSRLY